MTMGEIDGQQGQADAKGAGAGEGARGPVVEPVGAGGVQPGAAPAKAGRGAVDIDKLLEETALAQTRAKERLSAADKRDAEFAERAKKVERLEQAQALMEKGDDVSVRSAIKLLRRQGMRTQEIIEALSLDEEISQGDPGHVEPPVAETVEAILAKKESEREAQRKKDEEAAALTKKTAETKERAEIQEQYVGEFAAVLKAQKEKFPLCAAWARKLTPERVVEAFEQYAAAKKKTAKPGENIYPEPDELLAVIEAEFQGDIDATPFGRKKEPEPGHVRYDDQVRARLDREDAAAAGARPGGPDLIKRTGTAPVVEGESYYDKLMRHLDEKDRLDASRLGTA